MSANGTKAINATSLVISMLEKKQRKTSTADKERVECTIEQRRTARVLNRPQLSSPATAAMSAKRTASVCTSIYERYAFEGGTKKQLISAQNVAIQNTARFLRKEIIISF